MNKKWGICEKNFQKLEGVVSFNSLGGESLILPSHMSKRAHYCKIMGNATLIKAGKSKKTLNIMNTS
jgi:hypothetical protein